MTRLCVLLGLLRLCVLYHLFGNARDVSERCLICKHKAINKVRVNAATAQVPVFWAVPLCNFISPATLCQWLSRCTG